MLLLLLFGMALAWFLQKKLYQKNWQKNLKIQVSFQDSAIYEGEESTLKEVIVNDKLLPIPALELGISMSRNLEFDREAKANASITDQSYKRDVFSFLFHQQVTRTLPFQAKKRGFYEITGAHAVAYDLFFREGLYSDYPQQTQMYVYPRQVDTARIQMICRAVSGMVLSRNRLYEDPFEFSGIRDYRKEDPMNRINWKSSARMGDLMVNQFDATTSVEVTVLLDIEDANILREEAQVEESIRITSSLAARMVKNKMNLWVKSNAKDEETGEELRVHLAAGAGKTAELNRKLACVQLGGNLTGSAEFLHKEAEKELTGHTYVVVSKNRTDEVREALHLLSGAQNQVLWVIPYLPGEEVQSRTVRTPQSAGRGNHGNKKDTGTDPADLASCLAFIRRHLWLCRRFSGADGKGGAVFLRHILIAADSGRRKLDSDPENESTLAVSAWRNCGLRGDVSGSEIFLFPVQCAGGSGN